MNIVSGTSKFKTWNFRADPDQDNHIWPHLNGKKNSNSSFPSTGQNSPETNTPRTGDGWASIGGQKFDGKSKKCPNYNNKSGHDSSNQQIFTSGNDLREYDAESVEYVDKGQGRWEIPSRGSKRIIAEFSPGTHQLVRTWLTRDHYCTFQPI
ncbi:hypothetical protein [Streptomyces yunnanensis]|uniref:hypothetical protein n=1 Tax=Streptomyces yunnanensis TaxID=156453 RepID=UPI00142E06AB|nr:hypothetical protein [Streptomyces yunnanensis]